MKHPGYVFFILFLLVWVVFSVLTPGVLSADTEKEKKKQTQSSESSESAKPAEPAKTTKPTESESQSKPEARSQPGPQSRQKQVITGEPKKYQGKPGTFIFHEADLKNVLLFFAKTYNLNMVIDPGVSGKVTVRLVNVPWDQALDLILRQQGLGMVKEGKVVAARKLEK